jgi:hypothetical protein
MWHINGMTVSNNGKYIHAAFPHMDWDPHYYTYCEKPKQYKLTTPWDVSTTPNNYDWVGIGPVDPDWQYVPTEPIQNAVRPTETNGAFPGHFHGALTHGIHWNSSGTKCYVSFVPETNASKDGGVATNGDIDEPILNTCHYFNQKVWEIDYDL